jgi:hypothetical protein
VPLTAGLCQKQQPQLQPLRISPPLPPARKISKYFSCVNSFNPPILFHR